MRLSLSPPGGFFGTISFQEQLQGGLQGTSSGVQHAGSGNMRVRTAVATVVLMCSFPLVLDAADAGRGKKTEGSAGTALGIVLGQPTGITARFGLGVSNSIEAKAAWDLAMSDEGGASFSFQANWLIEFPGVLRFEQVDIPPYIGAGIQLDVGSGLLLGFRIPAGLIYRFEKFPLEVFVEVGLGMGLIPSTKSLISGGVGVRYILAPPPKR